MLRQLRAFLVGESYWKCTFANGKTLSELDTRTVTLDTLLEQEEIQRWNFLHRDISKPMTLGTKQIRVRNVEWLWPSTLPICKSLKRFIALTNVTDAMRGTNITCFMCTLWFTKARLQRDNMVKVQFASPILNSKINILPTDMANRTITIKNSLIIDTLSRCLSFTCIMPTAYSSHSQRMSKLPFSKRLPVASKESWVLFTTILIPLLSIGYLLRTLPVPPFISQYFFMIILIDLPIMFIFTLFTLTMVPVFPFCIRGKIINIFLLVTTGTDLLQKKQGKLPRNITPSQIHTTTGITDIPMPIWGSTTTRKFIERFLVIAAGTAFLYSLAGYVHLGYSITHGTSLLLVSRSGGDCNTPGHTTFLPLHYIINPPVKQHQGVF